MKKTHKLALAKKVSWNLSHSLSYLGIAEAVKDLIFSVLLGPGKELIVFWAQQYLKSFNVPIYVLKNVNVGSKVCQVYIIYKYTNYSRLFPTNGLDPGHPLLCGRTSKHPHAQAEEFLWDAGGRSLPLIVSHKKHTFISMLRKNSNRNHTENLRVSIKIPLLPYHKPLAFSI